MLVWRSEESMWTTHTEMTANLYGQICLCEPSKERAGRDPPAEHPSVSPLGGG
jgi:hypothetical protein